MARRSGAQKVEDKESGGEESGMNSRQVPASTAQFHDAVLRKGV